MYRLLLVDICYNIKQLKKVGKWVPLCQVCRVGVTVIGVLSLNLMMYFCKRIMILSSDGLSAYIIF